MKNMKKTLILAAMTLAMCACGNAASNPAPAPQTAEEIVQMQYELTDQGVGPIRLGMKVAEIPPLVPGLYDRVEKVETPDADEYQFFKGEQAIFAATDEGDGEVGIISLFNESPIPVKTANGENWVQRQ